MSQLATPPSQIPSVALAAADALVAGGYVARTDRDAAAREISPYLGVLRPASADHGPRPLGRLAAEIAGYLGGVLVVAAGAVFLASQWSRMDGLARVLALLASAAVLAAAGAAVRRTAPRSPLETRDTPSVATEVRRLLASSLLVAAAALTGGAAGVWAVEMTDLVEPRPQTIGFVVAGVLMGLGYRFVPSAVAQAGMAVTAVVTSATLVFDREPGPADSLVFAGLLLAVAATWLVLSETGVLHELAVGRVVGSVLAIFGAHTAIGWERPWVAYLLLALVGVAGLVLYARTQSWTYLALGVVALTLSVTEAAVDWSDGALGAAGALLLAGAVLLLVSVLGLRLRSGRHS